jgi:hypothetical protein
MDPAALFSAARCSRDNATSAANGPASAPGRCTAYRRSTKVLVVFSSAFAFLRLLLVLGAIGQKRK